LSSPSSNRLFLCVKGSVPGTCFIVRSSPIVSCFIDLTSLAVSPLLQAFPSLSLCCHCHSLYIPWAPLYSKCSENPNTTHKSTTMFTKYFATAALAATTALGNSYQLVEESRGVTFFDNFDFQTDSSPTHGTSKYMPRAYAAQHKLIGVVNNNGSADPSAYIGVGSTNVTEARLSIRLESKNSYNHALVLADIKHMPSGPGLWPALWMVNPTNWPAGGEIDIIEQVNNNPYNTATLYVILLSLSLSELC